MEQEHRRVEARILQAQGYARMQIAEMLHVTDLIGRVIAHRIATRPNSRPPSTPRSVPTRPRLDRGAGFDCWRREAFAYRDPPLRLRRLPRERQRRFVKSQELPGRRPHPMLEVEACTRFVRWSGKPAFIGSLDRAAEILEGTSGTRIVP